MKSQQSNSPRLLKVASIQFSPHSYNLAHNLTRATELAESALKQGAKLIVLPELFDGGYCVEDRDISFAIPITHSATARQKTLSSLAHLARTYQAYIVACSIEKMGKKLFDTAFLIGAQGLIGKYRKIYLFRDEKKRFSKGAKYPVFTLDFGDFTATLGLQICYEIGFGEGARILALQGAEIICYPSAFGKARAYVWDLASRARALENGAFVIAANRCGSEISKLSGETITFAGRSKIINPKGEILSHIDEEEGIVYAEINIQEVKAQREYLTYLDDVDISLNKKMYAALHKMCATL